jgi:hypothetical protein
LTGKAQCPYYWSNQRDIHQLAGPGGNDGTEKKHQRQYEGEEIGGKGLAPKKAASAKVKGGILSAVVVFSNSDRGTPNRPR